MITTNNKKLYDKLIMLRTHGITKDPSLMHENHGGWYYEMQVLGYNYRLTDIQCALGCSQLKKAGERLLKRKAIAARYDRAFKNTPVKHLAQPKGNGHAYHLYIIKVKNRKELYDRLRSQNIFAQVHYIPVYQLPYYQKLGYRKQLYPFAEDYYQECLSIPMYPSLTNEEQDFVIEKILDFNK
jgi:dTDP-4-amino-4,6-dideoxygalactose transaminase